MAIQQIKAYVEVQSPAQLADFKGVSSDLVVRAYQINWRLKESITNLLAALAGQRGPYIITGPRGAGKSHLLTVIRALTTSPGLSNALRDPAIVSSAGKLSDEKFFVIELDITSKEPPDLLSMIREELATRDHNPVFFSDTEWGDSISGSRVFKLIRSKLPYGAVLALFIDGISLPMRSSKRTQSQISSWLGWVADQFREQSQGLIITLDEDILSEVGNELLRKFKVERVDTANLRDIADRFILKKNDQQRQELGYLYNEIVRLMPQFAWSKEDFTAVFPIHPAVLEVAAGLRIYSRSFSLLGFISSAASKASNRRAMNLSALDELFDGFEFELRKNENLASLFATYDFITQSGIGRLTNYDEKMWAKIALKALFIFSLAGKSVTISKLADSVMLYDDRDFKAGSQRISRIIECFLQTAPDMIEVAGEGRYSNYRFVIKTAPSTEEILAESIEKIADNDIRLTQLLITVGGEFFSDWPLKFGQELRAEFPISWRNSSRLGILKLGIEVELFPVTSSLSSQQNNVSLGVGLITPDIGDDEELLPIDLLVEPAFAQTGEYILSQSICEWDWQVCLIPLLSDPIMDFPYFNPPTLIYWTPEYPTREDLNTLKKALIFRTDSQELTQAGVDCLEEQKKVDLSLQEIFQRLYVDGGKFNNPGSDRPILIYQLTVAGSTITEMFSSLMAESLYLRYPEHPHFGQEITEETLINLTKNFFGKLDPFSSDTQAYLENCALPLKLVSPNEGQYVLDLSEENTSLAVTEISSIVLELRKDSTMPIRQLYTRLRAEPFGLSALAQKLVLMALVSDWKIELTSENGSQVLNPSKLALESNLSQYTHIRISSITHSPLILCQWYSLLTSSEEEMDLVNQTHREQMREGLKAWQENWVSLRISDQLEKLPVENVTTKLSQMVVSCNRYFEAISEEINDFLSNRNTLEECLTQIIDNFSAKDTVYFRAVNELTLLINFFAWLPFFDATRKYILAAENTNNSPIESLRSELNNFLQNTHSLLTEENRQLYESVYSSFQVEYKEYYLTKHNNVMSLDNLTELEDLLTSKKWRNFELMSQLSIARNYYYLLAMKIVKNLKANTCSLPTKELLDLQPYCNCSFRLNHQTDKNLSLELLKHIIDIETTYIQKLLTQYQASLNILNDSQEEKKDLETVFASFFNGETEKLTFYTVEKFNQTLAGKVKFHPSILPTMRLANKANKADLRDKFEHWLENLPDEPGIVLDFSPWKEIPNE